ncbi:hypothetical protein J2747_001348 [Thermococcus stetteri]|nr:hypothetical protein [Thermococcus stetteri]
MFIASLMLMYAALNFMKAKIPLVSQFGFMAS